MELYNTDDLDPTPPTSSRKSSTTVAAAGVSSRSQSRPGSSATNNGKAPSQNEKPSTSNSATAAAGGGGRPVRIVVHDKAKQESRTYSCDAILLRSHMAYFASVLDQLMELADRTSHAPLSLNVNCDIPIFGWLMEYINGRNPVMLPTNVVSLILSSNFLLMSALYDEGLLYLKTHLVDVLLTDVNMDCIPNETTSRLAQLMSEDDVAAAVSALIEGGNERCANRGYVGTLLKHMTQLRYCDDPVSLRWCQCCGTLVDVDSMRATNALVGNEVACPSLGQGLVGARGEKLRTHEATIAVSETLLTTLVGQANASSSVAPGMLLGGGAGLSNSGISSGGSFAFSSGGAGGSSSAPSLAASLQAFLQISGGDVTEFVCWRLIASCRFYRCGDCDSCVALISIRHHECSSNGGMQGGVGGSVLGGAYASAMNPTSLSNWQGCLLHAREKKDVNLVTFFAEVLPTLPPIRRTVAPSHNVLVTAASPTVSAAGVPLGGSAFPSPSAYATPPLATMDSNIGTGAPGSSSSTSASGPILWRQGAVHTIQSIQGDGTPNVELIRFHENLMMMQLSQYVNRFSSQCGDKDGGCATAAPSTAGPSRPNTRGGVGSIRHSAKGIGSSAASRSGRVTSATTVGSSAYSTSGGGGNTNNGPTNASSSSNGLSTAGVATATLASNSGATLTPSLGAGGGLLPGTLQQQSSFGQFSSTGPLGAVGSGLFSTTSATFNSSLQRSTSIRGSSQGGIRRALSTKTQTL